MKINIYMLAVILTPLSSHHSKYFNVSLSKQTNKTINNHNIVTSKLLFSCTVKTSFTSKGNVKVVLKVDKKIILGLCKKRNHIWKKTYWRNCYIQYFQRDWPQWKWGSCIGVLFDLTISYVFLNLNFQN